MQEFGQHTYPEISAQAEALNAAYAAAEQGSDWIHRFIGNDTFDEVIFIGSGSSYYQAQTMAVTFRKWLGRSAAAYPSSEIYLFREQAAVPGRRYLLVGVSRSGESTEVIQALDSVKGLENWTTCGITCYENSTMAQMVPCITSPLGKEQSTVMTRSFSSMTFLMQTAIAFAADSEELASQMKSVSEKAPAIVKSSDAAAKQVIWANEYNKFIYLGMGAYFGLAQEASLKIKEMSYVWTESFGSLEFRHGPKSVVDPGTFICLLVSEQARSFELRVAEEMKGYGAYVMLITAKKGDDTAFADAVLELGGAQLSDEARSVLYLPVLQYLGYYNAIRNHVDPDNPRNLTKVVTI